MDIISSGRIIILEEIFIKTKAVFTVLALLVLNYIIGEDFPRALEMSRLLTIALIIYIFEGIIFAYKTQIKSCTDLNVKPSLVSLIIDISVISALFFLTVDTRLNLYPLFLVFILIQTLRFPRFHATVFALTTSVIYLGILSFYKKPASILTGEVLINIAFFYLFAFIINEVVKEINSLVNQVSLAQSQLKEKNERLREMAQKDLMTDLLNHKTFHEIFHSLQRQQYSENRVNFCLAMLDIDNFKQINDSCGHPAGDYVLIEVSKIIKGEIRSKDIAARYGGEEFAIIFTDTNLAEGVKICERIRRKVLEREFNFDNNKLTITISGGVSSNDLYLDCDDSYFIQCVDDMLYEAKQTGKNKIIYKDVVNPISSQGGRL
ncbi:MAG: GGDEF domain-containing protein [Bacillota bacterium]